MSNNIQIDNNTLDKLRDKASGEAYIRACELVGLIVTNLMMY